ncbi:MAG: peptide chain release factor 1 [Trueperaceae bacterium]|nr:peptide chain release factor 1 [Trueperaceae bacterium]
MTDSLHRLETEFEDLERALADPEVLADPARYREASRRYGDLRDTVAAIRRLREVDASLEATRDLVRDPDLADLARDELATLETQRADLDATLRDALAPKDPYDGKDVILEIRAAAGGDEASLFARELLDAYRRYAERRGFVLEMLDASPSGVGGLKEASCEVRGRGAYGALKFESGVHRVQRVPETETQGRIHTSTVTVAVLPEAEAVDVALEPSDYRVDVFRASGPGGQSVNTTDSAVRLTYHPGAADEIVVTCQDGKSQHKNKEKALAVLRARLLERERARADAEAREARLVQIGSGDRSEKVRTYNVPQSRVTDHRIGFTSHDLAGVLGGDFDALVEALRTAEREAGLADAAVPERTGGPA